MGILDPKPPTRAELTATYASKGVETSKLDKTEAMGSYTAKKVRNRPLGQTKVLLNNGSNPGFPTALTAPDGNMLVAWREGANHAPSKGVINIARYTQAGAVVQASTTAATDATYDVRDPGLTLLADGRIALSYFVWDQINAVPLLDAVRVTFSSDSGVTWSAPVVIDSAFTTWSAAAGVIVQLPNGDLLIPTYGSSAGTNFQHAHVSRSRDGGATWAPLAVIANGDTQGSRHYQEPNIILTDRGDLLALIRSDTALAHYKARSSDGGVTWSTPVQAFPGNGAPRITNQGGYLHAVHRHESTGRTVKISSPDSGETWSNQIVLPIYGAYTISSYGIAVPYGKDSLRYIYAHQTGDPNNVATGVLLQVDAIVPEDRIAPGPIAAHVKNTASVNVPTATWTALTFSSEDYDTADMHSTTSNTTRIVIQQAGYYFVKGTVYFAAHASTPPNQVQARVMKNGVTALPGLRDKKLVGVINQDSLVNVADVVSLGVGDYLELQAYQDSGVNLSARYEDTIFTVALISALV